MNNILFISLATFIFFSCSKEEKRLEPISTPLTGVELAISNGVSMESILADYPVTDLYGKNYQGGLIFYVDSVNATGLVAMYDLNNDDDTTYWWGYNYGYPINGLDNSIMSGQNNTNLIVYPQGVGDYAAYYCDTLNHKGYSDWFMPSLGELAEMQRKIGNLSIANFHLDAYMSSTQDSLLINTSPVQYEYKEIGVHFGTGDAITIAQHNYQNFLFQMKGFVRPVRQFN